MRIDYNKMIQTAERVKLELDEEAWNLYNVRMRSLMIYAIDHGHELPDNHKVDMTIVSPELSRTLLLETLGLKQVPVIPKKDNIFDYNRLADFSLNVITERGFIVGQGCEILANFLMRYALEHDDKLPKNHILLDSFLKFDVIFAVFKETLDIVIDTSLVHTVSSGKIMVSFPS